MPGYALLFMLFTMASVGLPGTSGFVGEFLSLVGTYQVSTWAAIVATTGIILGAAYMLWLYWRIAFGAARNAEAAAMPDLSAREWWLLAPIAAAVLWMGVYPESFLRPMRADVGRLLERIERAAPRRRFAADRRQAAAEAACSEASAAGGALMNQFAPILPELILTVGAIVLMMVAAFTGRRGAGADQLGVGRAAARGDGRADRRAVQRRAAVRRADRRRRVRRVRQGDHLPRRRRWRSSPRTAGSSAAPSMAPNIRC